MTLFKVGDHVRSKYNHSFHGLIVEVSLQPIDEVNTVVSYKFLYEGYGHVTADERDLEEYHAPISYEELFQLTHKRGQQLGILDHSMTFDAYKESPYYAWFENMLRIIVLRELEGSCGCRVFHS